MGRFDVVETEDSLEYRTALPDFDEDDIEVSVDGDQLTVSATHEAAEIGTGEDEEQYVDEENSGLSAYESSESFVQCFTLPPDADAQRVEASFDDGMLVVRVAKMPDW